MTLVNVLLPLLLLALVVQGGFVLRRGWRALDVARQLLSRRTVRIADLQEGLSEVRGTVEAENPPLAAHGAPCAVVLIELHHRWTVSSGKNSTTKEHSEKWMEKASTIGLADDSGRCLLSLEQGVELLALGRKWTFDLDEFRERFPMDVGRLGPARHGKVIRLERCIEVGQTALASGLAVPDPDAAPGGYRQGAGARFFLQGDSERKLLIASRNQPLALLRACLAPALLLLCGLGLLVFAGWFTWLLASILRP
ncbi:MAG: hypothetical protein MUF64_32145 [Polyangiaceae bacterium]|nr:hypothetical protein [Polyangiaceae bacterium]